MPKNRGRAFPHAYSKKNRLTKGRVRAPLHYVEERDIGESGGEKWRESVERKGGGRERARKREEGGRLSNYLFFDAFLCAF
jgi:hypothetical protein